MTGRERMEAVFSGKIPDKVPHFELVFQIPDLAFGKPWPDHGKFDHSTAAGRDAFMWATFEIWDLIIEKYGWAALPISSTFAKKARDYFGDCAMVFDFNGSGTFWMPQGKDMMDFAVMIYEEPDRTHEQARQKMRASIELAKRQIGEGADFIVINSDYGYNQGPFVSPEKFAEIVTPYLAEIVGEIHRMGSLAILHSDGDLRLVLDQLVSTGLDGYQSIDPQGNMDIAEVKRQYGDRLILVGNVKTALLQEVNEPLIRGAVDYCMNAAKPGGRYVFSSSNCIFAGLPLESYHVMLDEYEKLAWY
ncbi:MAG: uroporphyrinogen decarboxylase family protein [Oscillospiraceae bacterium]|nr:uroporphyrinogen decarboxylase family protein [Oscillospiraceae bacterium]